ncbi:MAG TPA: glycosyltransferase family A protein [Ferruginibacter sp.]|nr:glycosyltransferase family A protein [Ferruginibacter sp.]
MRSLAPIVLFVYNRPDHTRLVLESLYNNRLADESRLWILVDGPKPGATEDALKAIAEVKKVIREKKWCKEVTIIEAPENKGIIKATVEGVSKLVNEFGRVIVMEDDNVASPGFLTYMNDALDFYENSPGVMHISAYVSPEFNDVKVKQSTFFYCLTMTWGWGTWKRAWNKFDPDPLSVWKAVKEKGNIKRLNMDHTFEFFWGLKAVAKGKLRSWCATWQSVVFLNDGLCLYPQKSLVSNIGHDGSGTNCLPDDRYKIDFESLADSIPVTEIPLKENEEIRKHNLQIHSFKYKFIFRVKYYLRYLVRY